MVCLGLVSHRGSLTVDVGQRIQVFRYQDRLPRQHLHFRGRKLDMWQVVYPRR